MLKPEKNLRWLGIDMRPRWRRRAAVIVTYLAFMVVQATVQDGGLWGHPGITAIVLAGAVWGVGVFSLWGPVKSFDPPPPRTAHGSQYVIVNGLDDLARYRYGVADYDAANEEQRSDLLQTYHVGRRLFPRKPSLDGQSGLDDQHWVDEREKIERVEAERWAHGWLMTMIACYAVFSIRRHKTFQPLEEAGDLLWFLILGRTLAQARVLWTEPDPREIPGDIELVPSSARN